MVTNFGYTLMTEQSSPKDLVRYAVAAEQVGFDFEVSSDHFSPWLVSARATPRTPGRCSARWPRPPAGSSWPRT